MSRAKLLVSMVLIGLFGVTACDGGGGGHANRETVSETPTSGRIEAGLRVLTLDPTAEGHQDFIIFRGDYVRLESTTGATIDIAVPSLGVEKTFPVTADQKAYFKVPDAGEFAYTANGMSGTIKAIDYTATGYSEVTAAEGAELIGNISPFVLDVRTPGEFGDGHLPDAVLVPVQVLQGEIGKLPVAKDKPILVYCRSGNRSTVAAKMLVDHGFGNVINLRGGIKKWSGAGLPVEK